MIIKYIPGLIGAMAGFMSLTFISWFENWSLEFTIFIIVYLVVTVLLEQALVRYGTKSDD